MTHRRRRLVLGTLVILAIAIVTGAALTGFNLQSEPGSSEVVTTEIITATDGGATANEYGLLPYFQKAYNNSGDKTHGYDLNGTGEVTEQCGNCHMSDGSGNATKHEPPLHPIGLYTSDTGDWFYDDGLHRGPNTRLANGYAGILDGNTQCGACHTPSDPSTYGFGPDITDETNGLTNDPHSVHRDVLTRIGCIRCHVYNNRTFDMGTSGGINFTQGNATRQTYGIANPINMTRVWDGKFLSTNTEAAYSYDAGAGGLNASGTGWNRYGQADGGHGYTYACPDCHDQYHQNGGLGFAFNDSASNRKGPWAPVTYTDSIGINSSGNTFTCGDCHVTDAHSVHTNGGLISNASWPAMNQTGTSGLYTNDTAKGAEYCDECHSQNLVLTSEGFHGGTEAAQKLGLNGSKNVLPDLQANSSVTDGSGNAVSTGNTAEDCGFCHKTPGEQ